MSVFDDDFVFHHSRSLDRNELPEGYFHILPFRVSPPREGMLDAIADAKAEWARATGQEGAPATLTAEEVDCPLMYVFP
jgi:geranylgeranyl diphosphate synthase, type III